MKNQKYNISDEVTAPKGAATHSSSVVKSAACIELEKEGWVKVPRNMYFLFGYDPKEKGVLHGKWVDG